MEQSASPAKKASDQHAWHPLRFKKIGHPTRTTLQPEFKSTPEKIRINLLLINNFFENFTR
jgi:hypothetical protein